MISYCLKCRKNTDSCKDKLHKGWKDRLTKINAFMKMCSI